MNNLETRPAAAQPETVYFPVPLLPPDTKPPAAVHSISLIKNPGGPDTMRIIIKRDLTVKIESFTFRYRFSTLPVYAPDSKNRFNSYVYSEEDVNATDTLTFNGAIPSQLTLDGCTAYISEIKLASGQVLSYDASLYRFVRRPAKRAPVPEQTSLVPSDPQSQAKAPAAPAAKEPAPTVPQTERAPEKAESSSESGKRVRRAIILTAFIFMLIIESIAGVYLYRYMGVKNSVDMLINDNRYNEAYKIASDAEYAGLIQRVCEKASVYYFSVGDLESAYVYAYGAPNPFTDMVIDYAAQSVVSVVDGSINANAFRVAKMLEDDEKFDAIIKSMSDVLIKRGDYSNALRVVSELRDEESKLTAEDTIFTAALNNYIRDHRYETASLFIDDLASITSFHRTDEEIIAAVLDCCAALGDNAGTIYFANRYPEHAQISASAASISAGDAGVRAELATIYPLLSTEQKRAYHTQTVALWNDEVILVQSGRIVGTEITNAVSVDTNEQLTLVLHRDGSVSALPHEGVKLDYTIPAYADVVQITLGENHAVMLHANGTVSALGDNTYGQCDVSEWSDIVAIAAGQRFTIGLKLDGTVVAVGSNSCGQCDVDIYRNVIDIAACNQSTVLLFSDGTVRVQGYRSMGLAAADKLTGVKRIRAGGAAIIAEKSDGRYELITGQSGGSYGDPYNWRNIKCFDVGMVCIAGIDKNDVLFSGGDGIVTE